MRINLEEMIRAEIAEGYNDITARSKVCQDIILKAISLSTLSQNLTIKGGVVMRGRTNNVRRATRDIDIDFIKYSIDDASVDAFIKKINCIDEIRIIRKGAIDELKQQDYRGKRVHVEITDLDGNVIESKIDLGVHTYLDIEQETYCFDIAFGDTGASVLINSNEQMLAEKLKSLLKFGVNSTRYKDIYDMFYLFDCINPPKLEECFKVLIFDDPKTRENSLDDIGKRLEEIFSNDAFIKLVDSSKARWIDTDIKTITKYIVSEIYNLK